ncbi:MAG: arylsulfatase [Cyclobacteriaceae bacterium]
MNFLNCHAILSSCLLWLTFTLVSCENRPQTASEEVNNSQQRPNILLIMADDMGYSDIGCYGGEIRTPNLDSLAANGLRFSQFYNTARCCPTRASLMTGLYPHQAGIGLMTNDRGTDGYRGDLNNESVTIAEVLKEAGYATYMSGKWHVTKHMGQWSGDSLTSKHNWPMQRGFDRFYGTILGAGSFYDPITLTDGNEPVEPEEENFYYTDKISSKAVEFISQHENEDQPFFAYVAYTAPHWPLHALPEDIARYEGRYDIGWDSLRLERLARMREMDIIEADWKLTERDEKVPAWEESANKEWEARRMEVYAAQVDRMDQGIGKIIKALEDKGELENTLIFFLADNGGCAEELGEGWGRQLFIPEETRRGEPVILGNEHTDVLPGPENTYQSYGRPWANASNTPFRLYKHYVHEGGISTPLIVHWPAGIANENGWRNEPGHLIDIMATCVDVAGAAYPSTYGGHQIQPMEGLSLLPVFEGEALEREAIYFEHEGNRAIRKGKWKLVSLGRQGAWELYDMESDRTETINLANEHPELVKELSAMWEDWAQRARVIPWPA